MTKTIHVTQEHIDKGVPNKPRLCPVSLALRDADFVDPVVGLVSCDFLVNGYRVWATMPDWVGDWIDDFDYELVKVKPFSFDLVYEPEVQ